MYLDPQLLDALRHGFINVGRTQSPTELPLPNQYLRINRESFIEQCFVFTEYLLGVSAGVDSGGVDVEDVEGLEFVDELAGLGGGGIVACADGGCSEVELRWCHVVCRAFEFSDIEMSLAAVKIMV